MSTHTGVIQISKASLDVDEFVSLNCLLLLFLHSALFSVRLLIECWPTRATFIHKYHCYRSAVINNMKCKELFFLLPSPVSPLFSLSQQPLGALI